VPRHAEVYMYHNISLGWQSTEFIL